MHEVGWASECGEPFSCLQVWLVRLAAEEAAQAARERRRLGGDAAAVVAEVAVAGVAVLPEEGVGLADERAAVVDDRAPLLARVVPPRVPDTMRRRMMRERTQAMRAWPRQDGGPCVVCRDKT